MGEIGPRTAEVLPCLAKALDDHDSRVRESAVWALGNMGPEAVSHLLKAAADPYWKVRQKAIEALPRLGAEPAMTRLVAALADPHKEVRQTATEVLQKLDAKWFKSSAARAAIPQLVVAISYRNEVVRQSARKALQKIDAEWHKTQQARKAILALVLALPIFTDAYYENSETRRQINVTHCAIRETLHMIDAEWHKTQQARDAISGLVRILGIPDANRNAIEILTMIDPDWRQSEASKELLPIVVKELIQAISTTEDWHLTRVIEALGNIGPQAAAAVPVLTNLRDSHKVFVEAAATALKKIQQQTPASEKK